MIGTFRSAFDAESSAVMLRISVLVCDGSICAAAICGLWLATIPVATCHTVAFVQFCCVSAVLKAVSNVNDIIAPALVGKVSGIFFVVFK